MASTEKSTAVTEWPILDKNIASWPLPDPGINILYLCFNVLDQLTKVGVG